MSFRVVTDSVFAAEGDIVRLGSRELSLLKERALVSPRRRARICAHTAADDLLHEMVIVILSDSYIRPHKHLDKSESFHIIEGVVDVVVFDDVGKIVSVIPLGDPSTERSFFYRLGVSAFHTLVIRSDCLVVHEVTNGPLRPESTCFAEFSPPEGDVLRASQYMEDVKRRVDEFSHSSCLRS